MNYSAYGIDLLAEAMSNREGYSAGAFGLGGGLGATGMVENDTLVYKDWSFKKRLNYGLLGEISGEWFMIENLTLRLILQQKILFNADFGRYRFLIGLCLAYRLNSY